MMGPGEVASTAAPKGNCKNSQAEGSDPDETPERKGFPRRVKKIFDTLNRLLRREAEFAFFATELY